MSYLCGYYRHYYPVEYCTSFLNCAKNDEDIYNGTELMKSLNIKLHPAKFRMSKSEYGCDPKNNAIYKGLSSIKHINSSVADELYELGKNQYNSFIELLCDIREHTSVNSKQMGILIKIGFFSEFGDVNKLLNVCEVFDAVYGKKQLKKSNLDKYGIPVDMVAQFADSETEAMYKISSDNIIKLLTHYFINANIKESTVQERLRWQLECLGYIDYVDPTADSRLVFVTNLNTKYSPKFDGYSIKTGKSCELRVSAKANPKLDVTTFAKVPFEDGSLMYMDKCDKKQKTRKTENGFEPVPGEFNWWVTKYHLINA